MNINIITGLPYTGKSKFGKILADKLSCPFIRDFDITLDSSHNLPSDKLLLVIQECKQKNIESLVFVSSSFVTAAERYLLDVTLKSIVGENVRYICFENNLELAMENIDSRLEDSESAAAKALTKELNERYSLPTYYMLVEAKRYETNWIQEKSNEAAEEKTY